MKIYFFLHTLKSFFQFSTKFGNEKFNYLSSLRFFDAIRMQKNNSSKMNKKGRKTRDNTGIDKDTKMSIYVPIHSHVCVIGWYLFCKRCMI